MELKNITNNNGSVLAVAILIVAVLLLIGVSFLFWIKVESRNATQKRTASKDIFYAEAGNEKTINRLQNDAAFAAPFLTLPGGFVTQYTIIIDGQPVNVTVKQIP
jgi:hypothetical protein